MPGKSQSHTDAVLNVLRGTDLTGVAPHVGLFSVAPADDNSAGTELAGNGYARQAITFGAPATDAGNVRKVANTNNISIRAGARELGRGGRVRCVRVAGGRAPVLGHVADAEDRPAGRLRPVRARNPRGEGGLRRWPTTSTSRRVLARRSPPTRWAARHYQRVKLTDGAEGSENHASVRADGTQEVTLSDISAALYAILEALTRPICR